MIRIRSPLSRRQLLLCILLILLACLLFLNLGRTTVFEAEERSARQLHPPPNLNVVRNTTDVDRNSIVDRIVHLDLKGAPPSLEYLHQVLPLWKSWGATGLLVEYEDMFPYEGQASVIRSENAYSKTDIEQLVTMAENNGLQVIPLVQTLGHMEFVLKHDSFHNYRAIKESPWAMDPCNAEAMELVKEMIRQIMALHPKSQYLHIGADEVEHLDKTPQCPKQTNTSYVYTQHVTAVARFVNDTYPGVTPLAWDDIMRKLPPGYLQALSEVVRPVVWCYEENIHCVHDSAWRRYAEVFPVVWFATAFKGASGPQTVLPKLNKHVHNHLNWLSLRKDLAKKYPKMIISGAVLTGWSRYNHFRPLCDLLPAALPSLALCLQVIAQGKLDNTVIAKVELSLSCPYGSVLYQTSFKKHTFAFAPGENKKEKQCKFPGNELFYLFRRHSSTMAHYDNHCKHKKNKNPCASVLSSLQEIKGVIPDLLPKYFVDGTADSWITQHVDVYLSNIKTNKTVVLIS